MRVALAVGILIMSIHASALTMAKTQDYLDIEDMLNKATALEDQITERDVALKKRETPVMRAEREKLRGESKIFYERAIWLTMRAYDLIPFADNEPMLPEEKSVLKSPEFGRKIKWVPVFEENGWKSMQDSNGNVSNPRLVDSRIAGNTSSDGISRLFPGAFTSPPELASYIIHEMEHFNQNTTDGLGNKKTTAELEVLAYEKELSVLDQNLLGYPKKIRERHKAHLLETLDGVDGRPGKRALAKRERAAADALRKGAPLPERSIVSLSETDVDRLVQQARAHIKIAQADHDERLAGTMLAMARRSCDAPGSVTQAELNDLPRPHLANFMNYLPIPLGPRDCYKVYAYLGGGGRNAAQIASMATPQEEPIVIKPTLPPLPPILPSPFALTFPDLAKFATESCRSPGSASPVLMNYYRRPYEQFVGTRRNWESWYWKQLNTLQGCPRLLFIDLVTLALEDSYWKVSERDWLKNKVARYSSSRPGPGGGGSSPEGGSRSGKRKEPDHDDVRRRIGGPFKP